VLVLDEPDNFLDVPAKRWLERELQATRKTVLFVSHDRELLAATATKIVTVEAARTWTHGGGFEGYHEARDRHHARVAHDARLYDDERARLEALVAEMRPICARSTTPRLTPSVRPKSSAHKTTRCAGAARTGFLRAHGTRPLSDAANSPL